MNPTEASNVIFARWMDRWPTLSAGLPFSTDNNTRPPAPSFATVAIIDLDSEQQTLVRRDGRVRWKRTGMIDVRLYGPLNVGRGPLDILVRHVRTIFEGKRLSGPRGSAGLITYATSANPLKNQRDSAQFWIMQAITSFEYTETR